MTSIQVTRNLRSNASISHLADMASDPEHISRSKEDLSFRLPFHNPLHVVRESTVASEPDMKADEEIPPSNESYRKSSALDVCPSLQKCLNHLQFQLKYSQYIARRGDVYICV